MTPLSHVLSSIYLIMRGLLVFGVHQKLILLLACHCVNLQSRLPWGIAWMTQTLLITVHS